MALKWWSDRVPVATMTPAQEASATSATPATMATTRTTRTPRSTCHPGSAIGDEARVEIALGVIARHALPGELSAQRRLDRDWESDYAALVRLARWAVCPDGVGVEGPL